MTTVTPAGVITLPIYRHKTRCLIHLAHKDHFMDKGNEEAYLITSEGIFSL
jgi:hypothetical protein